jgi:hypothetical protein
MKYAKWFYDISGIIGGAKLQGSITTSLRAKKRDAVKKIVARHFYGQPIIGWNIDKIETVRVVKED